MSSQSQFAEANGIRLQGLIAAKGDPLVLLQGFAETSHMWLPPMAKLADRHTVIAAAPAMQKAKASRAAFLNPRRRLNLTPEPDASVAFSRTAS
jgi:hypothetical protein